MTLPNISDRPIMEPLDNQVQQTVVLSDMSFRIAGNGGYRGLPCIVLSVGEGKQYSFNEVVDKAKEHNTRMFYIIGDNLMEQPQLVELLRILNAGNFRTVLQTSAKQTVSAQIGLMNVSYVLVYDRMKNMQEFNVAQILTLRPFDQIQFVVGSQKELQFIIELLRAKRTKAKIYLKEAKNSEKGFILAEAILRTPELFQLFPGDSERIRMLI